jgi:hypothetical protein
LFPTFEDLVDLMPLVAGPGVETLIDLDVTDRRLSDWETEQRRIRQE